MRAEFGSGPLWDDDWDGEGEICPDPTSLGLSPVLSADLMRWQDDYDSTLDHAYPPDSAFTSEATRVDWEQRGIELFERLRRELGETVAARLDL